MKHFLLYFCFVYFCRNHCLIGTQQQRSPFDDCFLHASYKFLWSMKYLWTAKDQRNYILNKWRGGFQGQCIGFRHPVIIWQKIQHDWRRSIISQKLVLLVVFPLAAPSLNLLDIFVSSSASYSCFYCLSIYHCFLFFYHFLFFFISVHSFRRVEVKGLFLIQNLSLSILLFSLQVFIS